MEALFALDFPELIHRAQLAHRAHFDARDVQLSTLLSIKTGACPEDCAYCPQSVRFTTGLEREELLPTDHVVDAAKRARRPGRRASAWARHGAVRRTRILRRSSRWSRPCKAEGLETCVTLGMLKARQAEALAAAGLDYYNHNLDTSPEYYEQIISTRTYQDRLDTLDHVRDAGLKVCCGGIVGMGEQSGDRAEMLRQLANLPEHPQSVPINNLVQVEGTPLHGTNAIDPLDFVRTIAVAKIMMPASYVRLAAGREEMSEAVQTLCFLAGANSIFYGDELLTTANPAHRADLALLDKLGMRPEASPKYTDLAPGQTPCEERAPQAARA